MYTIRCVQYAIFDKIISLLGIYFPDFLYRGDCGSIPLVECTAEFLAGSLGLFYRGNGSTCFDHVLLREEARLHGVR